MFEPPGRPEPFQAFLIKSRDVKKNRLEGCHEPRYPTHPPLPGIRKKTHLVRGSEPKPLPDRDSGVDSKARELYPPLWPNALTLSEAPTVSITRHFPDVDLPALPFLEKESVSDEPTGRPKRSGSSAGKMMQDYECHDRKVRRWYCHPNYCNVPNCFNRLKYLGNGLFAERNIAAGQDLLITRNAPTIEKKDIDNYSLQSGEKYYDLKQVLLGASNHSCSPNAQVVDWFPDPNHVDGNDLRTILVMTALVDIPAEKEVAWHYGDDYNYKTHMRKCLCHVCDPFMRRGRCSKR